MRSIMIPVLCMLQSSTDPKYKVNLQHKLYACVAPTQLRTYPQQYISILQHARTCRRVHGVM